MMSLSEARILGTDRQDVDHQLDDDDVRYWRRRDAAQGGVEPRREEELRVDLDLLQRGHALGRGDSTPRSPLASQRPRRHRARGGCGSAYPCVPGEEAVLHDGFNTPPLRPVRAARRQVFIAQLKPLEQRRRRCPLPATTMSATGDDDVRYQAPRGGLARGRLPLAWCLGQRSTAAMGNEIRAALAAQDASFEFNAVVRGWPGCTHKPLGCGRTNSLTAMMVWIGQEISVTYKRIIIRRK